MILHFQAHPELNNVQNDPLLPIIKKNDLVIEMEILRSIKNQFTSLESMSKLWF